MHTYHAYGFDLALLGTFTSERTGFGAWDDCPLFSHDVAYIVDESKDSLNSQLAEESAAHDYCLDCEQDEHPDCTANCPLF
jgi:hypothetical protein